MNWQLLNVQIEDEIAYITLNRKEKLNAFNFAMFQEMAQVIRWLHKQHAIRVVVLAGAGGNFSSGLDVKSVTKSPWQVVKLLFKWLPGNANLAQRVSIGWQRLPMPVIAVIEGRCYGAGMQVVLGADVRIAAPDSELSIMEAKWGLVPDMAGLVGLRQVMTKDKAMLLSLSAEVIAAKEALSLGLVTQIADNPMAQAKTLAEQIKATSPDAAAAIKLSINRSWSASIRSLLARESWSQVRLLLGKNRIIAAIRQTKDPLKSYVNRQPWW